jgi:hypothetical protein
MRPELSVNHGLEPRCRVSAGLSHGLLRRKL